MASVNELEQDIEATRSRLNGTIDRIQEKLTVSGIVDEVMGQAGVPRLESGHDFVLSLLRRHPLPLMIAAAGLGLAVYQMNRKKAARLTALPHDQDDWDRHPALEKPPIYAPDLSLTSPSTDPDARRYP